MFLGDGVTTRLILFMFVATGAGVAVFAIAGVPVFATAAVGGGSPLQLFCAALSFPASFKHADKLDPVNGLVVGVVFIKQLKSLSAQTFFTVGAAVGAFVAAATGGVAVFCGAVVVVAAVGAFVAAFGVVAAGALAHDTRQS